VKEFLSRGGHAFVDRNVEEDAAAYDALLATGYRTVPLTAIGNRLVPGYDPAALTTALTDAG
jgi:hypothetical protein